MKHPDRKVQLTQRMLREWFACDPRLIAIVLELLDSIPPQYRPLEFNSIFRTLAEERQLEQELTRLLGREYTTSHIHTARKPHRAADLDKPDNLPPSTAKVIAERINKRWQYDPDRPHLNVILYHLGHWHCQIHPRTRRRGET